jgi:SAM-dependent methyltransferase
LTALVFFVHCPVSLGVFSLKNITAYLSNLRDLVIWYRAISSGTQRVWELVLGVSMLGVLTVAIVYLFVPFGRLLGRLLGESSSPLRAYTINILGSLAGILLFTLLSFVSSPPPVWFGLFFAFAAILIFAEGQRKPLISLAALTAISLVLLIWRGGATSRGPEREEIWSPYQKLDIVVMDVPVDGRTVRAGYVINVNNVPYQQAVNLSYEFVRAHPEVYGLRDPELMKFDHYHLPYLFANQLDDVLIVGAGSGNDAAGAVRNGVRHIDAVEIDPRIIDIGKKLHPERPYWSERVNVVNDDARSFFHRTNKSYDLVVFGLLDSHTLSSNLSNVRLDNFVYTMESIEQAKSLLKPDGVLVLIFDVRDSFMGQSLFQIMTRVFGQPPLCFKLKDSIRGWGGSVFVGGDAKTVSGTMARNPFLHTLVDRSFATAELATQIPTDDWPYLYLNGRRIPSLHYIIFGMLMLISAVMVRREFSGAKGIDWHFFFLGAGFLLIEVQNVSKLALLFGATWLINSIITSAILTMILLANYFVARIDIKSLAPYYAGLILTLIVIYFFPLGRLAALSLLPRAIASGTLLSLPIFFAGIIFADSFKKAADLGKVFASNLLGAMLGGMLECTSFIVGIRALLLLAFALYLLSYAAMRTRAKA